MDRGNQRAGSKIVAQLLPYLPSDNHYRVVFMHRPLTEVVSSQKKLLRKLGKSGARISDAVLMQTFQKQLKNVRTMLNRYRELGVLDFLGRWVPCHFG